MKRLAAFFVLMVVAGCIASCGGSQGLQGMSAEQIAATAKMKDANITCVTAPSPWGQIKSLFINLDKGVMPSGNLSVSPDCSATITNDPVSRPASSAGSVTTTTTVVKPAP